jgi:DNA (cytosine-5)-methyltransferase 1
LKKKSGETMTFADLFCGIGGFRLAFENAGCTCVFSSEIDKFARQTYTANFRDEPCGDITKIKTSVIPKFDILTAGFPCQAFSIAGVRRGFDDTRGTLFFEIARLLKFHEPKAFLLENVKGLLNHEGGRTFETIMHVLKSLNYQIFCKILNAKNFGLPQNRERIFIVGFRNDIFCEDFAFPKGAGIQSRLRDILDDEVSVDNYWNAGSYETLKRHKERNAENGFGYRVCDLDGIAYTLMSCRYARKQNLIADTRISRTELWVHGKNLEAIRIFTPRECARLQGFPENFVIPVSKDNAYRQFGNSVAVPVVKAIAERIVGVLERRVIALHDSDKTKFPNLALMKISAWHKAKGELLRFAENAELEDNFSQSCNFNH